MTPLHQKTGKAGPAIGFPCCQSILSEYVPHARYWWDKEDTVHTLRYTDFPGVVYTPVILAHGGLHFLRHRACMWCSDIRAGKAFI